MTNGVPALVKRRRGGPRRARRARGGDGGRGRWTNGVPPRRKRDGADHGYTHGVTTAADRRLDQRDRLALMGYSVLVLVVIATLWTVAMTIRGVAAHADPMRSFAAALARAAPYWGIRAALAPLAVILFQAFPPLRRNSLRLLIAFLVWTSAQNSVQATVALGRWGASTSSVFWSIGANLLLNFVIFAGIGAGWTALRNHRTALERIASEARTRRALLQARFGSLRAQLNPDFVLGALGRLSRMALRGDFRGVTYVLSRLGELLRATLDTRNDESLDLATEIAMVSILADIHGSVDERRIALEIDVAQEALHVGVPPFSIQSLVQAALDGGADRIRLGAALEGGLLSLQFVAVTPDDPGGARLLAAAEVFRKRLRYAAPESWCGAEVREGAPGVEVRLAARAAGERLALPPERDMEAVAETAPRARIERRRLERRDVNALLGAVSVLAGAIILIDVVDTVLMASIGPGSAPLGILIPLLRTWAPFAFAIPLVVGLLQRFPPSLRTLPIHAAGALGLAWTQVASIASIGAVATGMERAPVLSLSIMPMVTAVHVLVYLGAAIAYIALERHREAVRRAESEEFLAGELSRVRLAVLRAQLNPHFLFNTLNAISTLALRRDAEGVTSSSKMLADLLRYAVHDQESTSTPLSKEIEAIDGYLRIQKLRFGERLNVEFDVDPAAFRAWVPRMILQPIVENAVLHGVAPKTGPGWIRIGTAASNGTLIITVEDDGIGLGDREPTTGLGLQNARERLRCLYGAEAGVVLEPREEGGTRTVVTIPMRLEAAS